MALPRGAMGCLRFVIVVFPDHTHLLFLKACKLALFTFCKNEHNIHMQIFIDNSTSVSYMNKFGGKCLKAAYSVTMNIFRKKLFSF